jgi:asparagine synthase (glutamine-hydrolysing)
MCGIAGFFDPAGAALRPDDSEPLLQRMIGAIGHRGPDASGVFVGTGAALAHARLSIVDLEGGRQPMATADGNVLISFNGEVFNYVELRRDLIERGHTFRTTSDTEVILHLYQEMGLECVKAFNGDFAFALWDAQRKQLMLARDRMGVRPLYYTHHAGRLYFASEVKSLLAVPGITAELDPFALDQIFTFWFPLASRTPFKNIFELPPAHVLIATPNGVEVRRYWQLEYPDRDDPVGWDLRSEREIADELSALLTDATRIRLRADVPVGTYLSGGLDSSIVTAMARQFARERLRSFSVTFESAEFDESAYQQEMVQALGTEHSSIACSTAEIATSFPSVIRHTERPILRTAPAPLFQLAQLVRQSRFKVVLTGEGADEVFGGYDIFKEAKLRHFCARQPQSKFRPLLFQRLYPYLPQLRTQPRKYVQAFFTAGLDKTGDPLFSHLPRFRTTSGAKLVFSRALLEALKGYDALAELRDSLPGDFGRWHNLCQAQYLEAAYLLPGYILSSQGDRVSMAHAVEGRFPFLDHRVVEFAARIPPQLKIRGLREKHILRESAKSLLPNAILNRTKQPYRAPEAHSFFGAGAPGYVADRLSAQAIKEAGYFDPGAVDRLMNKCASGNPIGQRENMALVGVLSTQLWREAFAQSTASAFKSAAA